MVTMALLIGAIVAGLPWGAIDVAAASTRMLLLDRGRVVQDGNPASLWFYITRIPYGGLNHLKCEWAFS